MSSEDMDALAEIKSLRKSRGGLRSRLSILQKELGGLLLEEGKGWEVEEIQSALADYVVRIRVVQEKIETLMDPGDELEQEIQEAMALEASVRATQVDIRKYLARLPTGEQEPNGKSMLNVSTNVEASKPMLPKWELPKFDGNVLDFPAFWDQFEAAVHSREDVSDVTRFVYLRAALAGNALEAISGYSVTAANYPIAIQVLKNRFGKPRVIVERHVLALVQMERCENASTHHLRKLHDAFMQHMRALAALKKDPLKGQLSAAEVLMTICKQKLPASMRKRWEGKLAELGQQEDDLNALLEYIESCLEVEETVTATFGNHQRTLSSVQPKHASNRERVATTTALQASVKTERQLCSACFTESHGLDECPAFLKLNVKQRWRMVKQHCLCFLCLRRGHSSASCEDRSHCCRKVGCSQPHNHLLHYVKTPRGPAATREAVSPGENTLSENEVHISLAKTDGGKTLLQTARARLVGPNGSTALVMCLLDVGSQRSFIRKGLADDLGLKGTNEYISILTFGNHHARQEVARSVEFSLSAASKGTTRRWLRALCVPQICGPLDPNPPLETNWRHLRGCVLSDRFPRGAVEIDVLIGADYYYDFVGRRIRKRGADEPVGVQSVLGWILCGKTGRKTKEATTTLICRVTEEESADLLLQQFWRLDSIGITLDVNEGSSQVERQHLKWPIQFNGERYVVSLPWRAEMKLPNNYSYALQRLRELENRMKKKPEEKQMDIAGMQEYIEKGWVEEVPDSAEKGKEWYLPHHAVIRDKDFVRKCRIVFDGSASYQGRSLNDLLDSGPALQNDLLGILLRHRRFQFALQADIEAMFLQIELQQQDRDFVRFLWRQLDPQKPLVRMRFTRVCFGLRSSPFLAMAVIRRHARDMSAQYERASAEVLRNMYVDDFLVSCGTEGDALSLATEATDLLNAGGFHLHKWRSNSVTVMQHLERCSRAQSGHEMKALGMLWSTEEDTLSYAPIEVNRDMPNTKRSMLKTATRVYDPLGLLAPYTVLFKVMLQELWKFGTDWDEVLPASVLKKWNAWKDDLNTVSQIKLPRWSGVKPERRAQEVELHAFCDASEAAYGVAIYIRLIEDPGKRIVVNLVVAKSRVAPVKRVSLPRLELLAALLGARLVHSVKKELDLEVHRTICWSDSMITLAWIRSDSSRWKQFVRNRVQEIQSLTEPSWWRYCPTKENVADWVSRGQALHKLKGNDTWWYGPKWLSEVKENWPSELRGEETAEEARGESRTYVHVNLIAEDQLDRLSPLQVGQLERLIRLTAWCLRFLWNSKKSHRHLKKGGIFSVTELREAENLWLKKIQAAAFRTELESLKNAKDVPASSRLLHLDPFLDDQGLVRIGGRLQFSGFCWDSRHQVILPHEGPFVYLLVRCYHERQLHAGAETTLALIRQRFWILRGRSLIKKVIRNCRVCRRISAVPFSQKMAPLPADRVTPAYPFERSGVDFAGPLYIRCGRRTVKAYVCLFTCMATRAVHLELVTKMSTDDFILALRRFIARRGRPVCIQSDNFQTFKVADHEIKRLFAKGNFEDVQTALSKDRIQWLFITPRAPWVGGYWERLIRSVKVALKKVLGKALVGETVLRALLCEIEARINARPLTFVSDDVNDMEPLTPFHFLTGRKFEAVPMKSIHENAGTLYGDALRKRWRLQQTLMSHLWKRWRNEYITMRSTRSKWFKTKRNPHVGDVVLIAEDNVPRQSWKLGRITKTHASSDGLIRTVTLKTENGEVLRSIRRLHLIEPAPETVMD